MQIELDKSRNKKLRLRQMMPRLKIRQSEESNRKLPKE